MTTNSGDFLAMEHRRFGKVVTKMLLPLKGLFEHRVGVVSTKNFHWTNNSSSNGMAYVFDVGNDIQLHPAIRKRDTWLLNVKATLSHGRSDISSCLWAVSAALVASPVARICSRHWLRETTVYATCASRLLSPIQKAPAFLSRFSHSRRCSPTCLSSELSLRGGVVGARNAAGAPGNDSVSVLVLWRFSRLLSVTRLEVSDPRSGALDERGHEATTRTPRRAKSQPGP